MNIKMMTMMKSIIKYFLLTLCWSRAQDVIDHNSAGGCDCMEYWRCVTGGGTPYSYCGLSESSVCCFFDSSASDSKRKGCGTKGSDSGKIGIAEPAEWPWHAAILEKPDDLYVCGATLVDESWILTAAHCVDDYAAVDRETKLKVRLGEYDVTTLSEPLRHEERNIVRVVVHPRFDNETLENDIALLRLEKSVEWRPNINVVCVPRRTISPSKDCVITGWGRLKEDSEHSVVLKEIPLPLWRSSDCQAVLRKQFGSNFALPNTTICAGAEGKDACDGDGGGPLVCEEDGRWYQVGIISFGIGCGRKGIPGVYTRVQSYHSWIADTILTS